MSACRFSLTALSPSDNNSASSSHCPAIASLAVAFARVLSHPHALYHTTAVLPYHKALTYIRARRRTTHHRRLPARHTLEQARPSTQHSQTHNRDRVFVCLLSLCLFLNLRATPSFDPIVAPTKRARPLSICFCALHSAPRLRRTPTTTFVNPTLPWLRLTLDIRLVSSTSL